MKGRKRTHDIVRKRVGDVDPGVMVHLTCAIIGLGRRGEIIHGLKRQPAAPLHADVRSHLSGCPATQLLAAREEIGTVASFFFADEILWCDNSNKTCSTVLLHDTICFLIFYIFLEFYFCCSEYLKQVTRQ